MEMMSLAAAFLYHPSGAVCSASAEFVSCTAGATSRLETNMEQHSVLQGACHAMHLNWLALPPEHHLPGDIQVSKETSVVMCKRNSVHNRA